MVDEVSTSVTEASSHLTAGPIAARIGEQVRLWRMEKEMSEGDLASALHLSVDAIRSAESGVSCFTPEEIVTICSTFGVNPSRFLGGVV